MALELQQRLRDAGLSQAALARYVGISSAAMTNLLVRNVWPKTVDRLVLKSRIGCWLADQGIPASGIFTRQAKKKTPERSSAPASDSPDHQAKHQPEGEVEMLLPSQGLRDAARKQFALFANPFAGEVQNDQQMFVNSEIHFAQESAWQAAQGGRMVALIGESGAGKTTLLDALKERVLRERLPVRLVEPSSEAMEETDTKGKTMKVADIHAAILHTLDADAKVARGAERRSRQVRAALEESTLDGGNRHLLLIEEAHALPIPTLNHLKRLHERMRLGRSPMLGILLVGHPELERKLQRHDVREVMQRFELRHLPPLGADLEGYLRTRASAAGRDLADFIDASGIDALRGRLVHRGGPAAAQHETSMLYPLNINNWMTAALNAAAELGAPKIDADIVRAL